LARNCTLCEITAEHHGTPRRTANHHESLSPNKALESLEFIVSYSQGIIGIKRGGLHPQRCSDKVQASPLW
jgi:hypothetical protein